MAITTPGKGWLPKPDANDVGLAAKRLRDAGVLSHQQHFALVERTDGTERLWRLTDAIRLHLGRRMGDQQAAVDPDLLGRLLGWGEGGVYKRIDENRELLELLIEEAPEFLDSHRWIRGWLESHDNFLIALTEAVQIPEDGVLPRDRDDLFPRPWPGSKWPAPDHFRRRTNRTDHSAIRRAAEWLKGVLQ